jgi:hypothetical protein
MKFWVRLYYSDLLIHFLNLKFTRLQKRLKELGFEDYYFKLILNLRQYSHKPMSRITKEDVDGYILFNNITGDELLKVQSISKMFMSKTESKKRKVIFLNNKKEFVNMDEVNQKLSHASDIKGLIERARQIDRHYCIKMNTMVKVCRMNDCEFFAYHCPAHKPIIPCPEHICDAHAPINFPVPA